MISPLETQWEEGAAPVLDSRRAGILLALLAVLVLVLYPWVYTRFLDPAGTTKELRQLETRVSMQPGDVKARLALATEYQRFGAMWKARLLLEETARLAPKDPAAPAALGVLYLEQNRYDRAAEAFRQSLERDGRYGVAHFGLGMAYRRQGQWQEAVASFQAAAQSFPQSAMVREQLADALVGAGRSMDAQAAREAAQRLRQAATEQQLKDKRARE